MITLKDISFSYQDSAETLFDGFSATLGGTARWTCIAGANGCGKTTLLKLIAGMLVPLSGSIKCGSAVYCAQNSTELPDNAYALFWDADNETRRFFSLLGIAAEQLERWETLSGGEKQRTAVASAVVSDRTVLIFDEPTSGLDFSHMQATTIELKRLAARGCTVLVVTHDVEFIMSCCTFIVEMQNGIIADSYLLSGNVQKLLDRFCST